MFQQRPVSNSLPFFLGWRHKNMGHNIKFTESSTKTEGKYDSGE